MKLMSFIKSIYTNQSTEILITLVRKKFKTVTEDQIRKAISNMKYYEKTSKKTSNVKVSIPEINSGQKLVLKPDVLNLLITAIHNEIKNKAKENQAICDADDVRNGNANFDNSYNYITGMCFGLYQNQIDAAEKCFRLFMTGTSHVQLIAEMQQGKSGAYIYLMTMFKTKSFINFYTDKHKTKINSYAAVICGMNYNNIETQIQKDLVKHSGGILDESYYKKQSTLSKELSANPNKLVNVNIDPPCLIVIEESHYGNNQNNKVPKWLDNISTGQNVVDLKYGQFILSVSATGFIESINDHSNKKGMVMLDLDKSYIGLPEYYKANRIFDLEQNGGLEECLEKEIIRQINLRREDQKKYEKSCIIVRVKNHDAVQVYRKKYSNLKTFEYVQNVSDYDLYNFFELQTKNYPKIIFVVDHFRAAINLDSEQRKNKEKITATIDYTAGEFRHTILQGLPGRMCGYFETMPNVNIYTHKETVKLYSEYRYSNLNYGVYSNESKAVLNALVSTKELASDINRNTISTIDKKRETTYFKISTIKEINKLNSLLGTNKKLQYLEKITKGGLSKIGVEYGKRETQSFGFQKTKSKLNISKSHWELDGPRALKQGGNLLDVEIRESKQACTLRILSKSQIKKSNPLFGKHGEYFLELNIYKYLGEKLIENKPKLRKKFYKKHLNTLAEN